MRRPLRNRVTWILCLALLSVGFMAAGSTWAQGSKPPKVKPVAPGEQAPPPVEAAPAAEPNGPKEPKVRPKPKKPKKARPTPPPPPPPPPPPVAPPPAPPPPPPPPPAPPPPSPRPEPPPPSARSRLPAAGGGGYSFRSPGRRGASTLRAAPTVTPNALSRRSADRATQLGPVVLRLRATRPWISRSGPSAQRQTILVFRLTRPGIVELVVTRIAPDCRVVGKFRVAGRGGLNRVRFRGRIGRRVLPDGTYRVTVRTLRSRAVPLRTRLVIVGRPKPLPGEIAAARASNTCAALDRSELTAAGGGAGAGPGTGGSSGRDSESALGRVGGVLGVQFTKAVELAQAVPPFLFVLLGLAIALLGLAAIPTRAAPNLRVRALLAYHRELIALGGTITLIGAALTYVVW